MALSPKNPIWSPQVAYKAPGESILYGWDFSEIMEELGETLFLGFPPVVTILPGSGLVLIGNPGIESPLVKHRIEGGTDGTDYAAQCMAKTTLDGVTALDTRILIGVIRVRGLSL